MDEINKQVTSEASTTTSSEPEIESTGTEAATGEVYTSKESKKSLFGWVLIVVLVLIVTGAVAYFAYTKKSSESNLPVSDSADLEVANIAAKYPDEVAMVNGLSIANTEYAEAILQTQQTAIQQGLDVTDLVIKSDIETQALTVLINTKLLIQAAAAASIEVDETRVTEEIAQIETNFGGSEALQVELNNLGITQDDLRDDITEQLAVDLYLTQEAGLDEIVVSSEEIELLYNEYAAQSAEIPALEDVAAQIEAQIRQEKQQAAVQAIIDALRVDAEIDIMV